MKKQILIWIVLPLTTLFIYWLCYGTEGLRMLWEPIVVVFIK